MPLERAVEYALSNRTRARSSPFAKKAQVPTNKLPILTRRESEMHLSSSPRDSPTARSHIELSISERTAENHVAKILPQLGLHSRSQIATRAGAIVDAAEGTAPGMAASDG